MALTPDTNWNRLVRHLTGESKPEEKSKTRDWILEDRARARLMDDLREVWEGTDHSSQPRDVDAAWEEISRELELSTETADPAGEAPSGRGSAATKERRSLGRTSIFARIAVLVGGALLMTALAVVYLYDSSSSINRTPTPKVFTTKPGQRATVRLADGSKVRLNAESRLEVTRGFGGQNRTVRLSGEAYFEVARDTATSFVVRTGDVRATALGTAFNVEAYAEADKQEVAVTEGVVSLESGKESVRDTVHLRADYLGMVYGSHLQALRDNAAVHRKTAWTKGQLVFSDTDFDEVTRRLERWYDVEIDSRIDSEKVDRLNATFHEESLSEVFEAISTALDLMYRREEKTVVFYRKS